jgi:acyl-CoA dehydrogenase
MEFVLSEEQKALTALAKDFCKREVSPEFLRELIGREPKDRMPWDLIKKMHDLGLRTLTVPEEYGGGGADLLTQVVVSETLGQYGGPVGAVLTPMWRLCGSLAAVGNKEQQDEIFNRVKSDYTFFMHEIITEPDHGHDPLLPHNEPGSGLKTFAYRDGDEYVINGEKCFCGNTSADLFWVHLRTDKNKPLSQSMSLLLVPKDAPGFSVTRINEFIVPKVRLNGDLLFENVRVPARNLVGEEGKGCDIFQGRLAFSLPGLGAQLGKTQEIYEVTKDYAKTRIQGGKPIFEHPTVGTKIVDMLTHIEQARLLVYKTAWEYDQAVKSGNKLVSPLGFNLCNAVMHELDILVAGHAAEVFGGRATLKELPIEGYIRSVYDHHHFLGTATFNRIKAMSMI